MYKVWNRNLTVFPYHGEDAVGGAWMRWPGDGQAVILANFSFENSPGYYLRGANDVDISLYSSNLFGLGSLCINFRKMDFDMFVLHQQLQEIEEDEADDEKLLMRTATAIIILGAIEARRLSISSYIRKHLLC
ncbi:hypothetical protein B0H17DRAFT_1146946 [Mycena rosella]|uniref:Uncharacterized protein n=1 Tax=Mycena rosella TaxID=1033263 RepID=A0AAD7CQ80_MYCRO|nr:hypothetical protein B0H17DRAFT_1146946 [Mycena rosella]